MSYANVDYPYAIEDSLGSLAPFTRHDTVGTATTVTFGGYIIQWASGGGASSLNATALLTGLEVAATEDQYADGEIACDVNWAGTSGVAPGLVARWAASAGADSGWLLAPVSPASPTGSWALYQYVDSSPEKANIIAQFAPAGLSGATQISIRWSFIGMRHCVKIWNAANAEPSWQDPASVMRVTFDWGGSGSTNKIGLAMVGATTTGQSAGFLNFKFTPWNKMVSPLLASMWGGQTYDNVDRNSYTCPFTCKKNTVLLIGVFNTKSTTPDAISSISATNLNVSTALASSVTYNTTASPTTRASFYAAKATADITAANLTVAFGGVSQNGCIIEILALPGVDNTASDGTSAVLNAAIDAPNTNATSLVHTQTFSKLAGLSGVAGLFAHNQNEAMTIGSGFISPTTTSAAGSPTHSGRMEYQNAQDTSVDMSWSTTGRRASCTAEMVYLDPTAYYPADKQQVVVAA